MRSQLRRSALPFAALVLAAGCGSSSGDGGDAGIGPDAEDLRHPESAVLYPPVVHAGFDGDHTFRVPVSTDLAFHTDGEPSWSSGDGSILDVEGIDTPDGPLGARGIWAMITTTGSGTTTVSCTIGEYTVTATVIVADYDSSQVDIGDTRYHTDEGGDRTSCSSCHEDGGGADHTPTEMAIHDDDALLMVATEGRYPDICETDDGDACTCDTEGCEREPGYELALTHEWDFTESEADGIIPYLRSLPPSGF